MSNCRRIRLFLLLAACANANPALAQDSDKLRWAITPYLWASDTTLDLAFQDTNVGGDIAFSDVLDVLDAAFMLHVEGGRGNWSAFADITYLATSDTAERPLLTVDSDNKQTFVDAAVSYWPQGVGSPFSVFAGLRYTGFDDRYIFRDGGTEVGRQASNADYYDALLGLRYRFDLAERWSVETRGDYGFGDSEGVFLLRASVAYAVGKQRQNRLLFGYQYKQSEYQDGDVRTEFQNTGPTAGFSFRF
jgi:hypothetical protein